MDSAGIIQVVNDVFQMHDTKITGGWVSIRCPLAQWTHQRGRDSRASAGISIQDQGTSVFNCMTCKVKVPFQELIRRYADYTGEDLDDLVEELEEHAYLGPRQLPAWGTRPPQQGMEEAEIIDKDIHLDLYDSAAGHPYLRARGISDETAELLQLKFDPKDPVDREPRILFPVFNAAGELHGFSGRAIRKTAKLKVRDYGGLRKAACVLGAHLITQTNPDKILVVEGLFDYAKTWENGFPAVAVMHSTLTEMQARILRDLGKPTYFFYDNPRIDEAGATGAALAADKLRDYQACMRVEYPEVWIEDDTEDEGGHWLKDPGELLAEDIEEMIANARLF